MTHGGNADRRPRYTAPWLAEPHVDVDTAANGKWYGMLIRQSFHGRTHLVSDVSGVMDVQVRGRFQIATLKAVPALQS